MFRPILLLSTLFALLGMSSACLSEAQWMSIMAPHTGAANAYDKNKFSDAKVRTVRNSRHHRLHSPSHLHQHYHHRRT